MKKILLFLITVSLGAACVGQTINPSGLSIGAPMTTLTGSNIKVIDSVTVESSRLKVYYGSTDVLGGFSTLASPTFTGTVTIPTPFTLGAVSVLTNGTELNLLDGLLSTAAELNYSVGGTGAFQGQIDLKVNISDTAAMLTPYINRADTASMLTNYINEADTASMLTPYILTTEIDLAASDTAAMLDPYAHKASPGFSGTITFDNGATIVNTDASTLTIDEANVVLTGDLGSTGSPIPKGWFTDIDVVNDVPFEDALFAQTLIFNVLDYGATNVEGNTDEDQTAIQNAIDAAEAYGTGAIGGTVIIPAGDYYITAADTLKSYVYIKVDDGAYFHFPEDYDGSMWAKPAKDHLYHCYVSGGHYGGATVTRTWVGLNLISTDNLYYVMFCKFTDMTFRNALVGINISTSGTGWANGNKFEDILIWNPISGIKTRIVGEGNGINSNTFDNIDIQTLAGTTLFGLDSITGGENVFKCVNVYDPVAPTYTVVIASSASYTEFLGGDLAVGGALFVNNSASTTIYASGGNIYLGYGKKIDFSRGQGTITHGSGKLTMDVLYGVAYAAGTPPAYVPLSSGNIVAATGIGDSKHSGVLYYNGASAIDITHDPQITVAQIDGTKMTIIGSSDTNTLTLDDGTGLILSAQCVLGIGDSITLIYISALSGWVEVSRSDN